jgi:hypothetical protein
MRNARRIFVGNRSFTWVHYQHVIHELPLVFNPEASPASLKNQLVRVMTKLRTAELVETDRQGKRQYFRLTDRAIQLYHRPNGEVVLTAKHDGSAMPHDAAIVTPRDDNPPSPIIDDQSTSEHNTNRSNLQPSEEAAEFRGLWNSHHGLRKIEQWTERRLRLFRKRLADQYFSSNWREGINRVAQIPFCCGAGPRGWRADVEWFLKADTLTKVMEGFYDRAQAAPQVEFGPGHYQTNQF